MELGGLRENAIFPDKFTSSEFCETPGGTLSVIRPTAILFCTRYAQPNEACAFLDSGLQGSPWIGKFGGRGAVAVLPPFSMDKIPSPAGQVSAGP